MTTVAHLRGIVAGAAIFTLFGSWWAFIGLVNWTSRPSWTMPAASVAAIGLLVLCLVRLSALSKFRSIDDPGAAAKGKRDGRLFGIIFGVEGALIALCSILLGRYGLSVWIPIATGVIVGAHFIPLAFIFRVPLYHWTGALSILGMVGCSLIHDANARSLFAGLVMAAVLWISAALLLRQAGPKQLSRTT
jgi:hypothetical protein